MTKTEILRRIAKALDAYERSGSRDLPSVKKSVPRAFLDEVDALTDAVGAVLYEAAGRR